MKKAYDHSKIEKKWQDKWLAENAYAAIDNAEAKKTYLLVEFPYPSGEGLHVGHVRSYSALDVVARKRRAQGGNVLYPIGWDAFGLPTENYALKTGKDPRVVTRENTDNYRRQIRSLGISFDWSREINTTDPAYYKWTQWIFLQMYKKGFAYKTKTFINWCPKDKIGLANEEVVDGTCERCGTPVEKREKDQWMLAITKYAQRLYDDLDTVDYIERAKVQQRNWIGPSEGAKINFAIKDTSEKIQVFTTRPDTIFGATYLVLAPEHPLVSKLSAQLTNTSEVQAYVQLSKNESEADRTTETKEKTGVELKGIRAINPANEAEIPVYIADYVLGGYGTGAIMAVPAHDERDHAFASKFNLPIVSVISPESNEVDITAGLPYTSGGVLQNSGAFNGMPTAEAAKAITEQIGGETVTTFKLRDWVFSRQRYWGEPIPMIHCDTCGWQPVAEDQLPVTLPEVEKYEPTDNGESPLAAITDWVTTTCPHCGGVAQRETDVMPNWAGSSWYYLRYTDTQNTEKLASEELLKYWTPVDWYNGGMEHTTLHLLYSRFWHKFLFDIGVVPTSEPYAKRTSHGLIMATDGTKMSKSKGNTVSPDDIVKLVGADSLRLYELFVGPFDQPAAWNPNGIVGMRRFIERVYDLEPTDVEANEVLTTLLNQTIQKVTEDIESLKFNTALSSLMILLNEFDTQKVVPLESYKVFLKILAPFAPHVTHELWEQLGQTAEIRSEEWPVADPTKLVRSIQKIMIQIDGKTRGETEVATGADKAVTEVAARAAVAEKLDGKKISRVVVVPGRLVNFVLEA